MRSVELSGVLLSVVLTLLSVEVEVTEEVEEVDEEVDDVEFDDSPGFPELSEQPQSKAAASTADKTVLPNVFIFIISCPFLIELNYS